MTATSEVRAAAGGHRHSGKLLIGLVVLGWLYALAQILTLKTPGSLAEIGPGMAIFAHAKAHLFGDPFAFESSFSFCVSSTGSWGVLDFFKAMSMWFGMILAMMLPVLFLSPKSAGCENAPSGIAGYVVAWLPFCAAAVLVQWGLQGAGMLSAHSVLQHTGLSVAIPLVVACAYFYLWSHPENLDVGAREPVESFHSGVVLGKRCLRCCGPPMLVMFVIGLMNVVGMLVLTVLMLLSMSMRSRNLSLFLGIAALGWSGVIAMA